MTTSSAKRYKSELPTLNYNYASFKNFILRMKAHLSEDDDRYDVLEGTFWTNNGIKNPDTLFISDDDSDDEKTNLVNTSPNPSKREKRIPKQGISKDLLMLVKRYDKANHYIYAKLVPNMHTSCNKILDGVPERNGKALWDAIVNEFNKPSRANMRRVLANYFHLQQRKGESVSDYVHRGNDMLEQITNFKISISNEIKLVVLLCGLTGKYHEVRLILELDETATYSSAVDKLKQFDTSTTKESRQRNSESSALMVEEGKKKDFSKYVCNACGKKGHIQRHCTQRNNFTCNYCRKKGHLEAACRKKKREEKANLVDLTLEEDEDIAFIVTDVHRLGQEHLSSQDHLAEKELFSREISSTHRINSPSDRRNSRRNSPMRNSVVDSPNNSRTSPNISEVSQSSPGTSPDHRNMCPEFPSPRMMRHPFWKNHLKRCNRRFHRRRRKRRRGNTKVEITSRDLLEQPEAHVYAVGLDSALITINDGPASWIIDSGATVHLCSDLRAFNGQALTPTPGKVVRVADGRRLSCQGKADIGHFKDVYFCPLLRVNLLSVSKLAKDGFSVTFGPGTCTIASNAESHVAQLRHGLYMLQFARHAAHANAISLSNTNMNSAYLWHLRLGHISYERLLKLQESKVIPNLSITRAMLKKIPFCEACALAKARHAAHSKVASSRPTRLLQVLYADVCGPVGTKSVGGKQHFCVVIDGASSRSWAFFLHAKSEVSGNLLPFLQSTRGPNGEKPYSLVTDGGGEFNSVEFNDGLAKLGVQHIVIPPYGSKANRAERHIRTITEGGRTLLAHSKLPASFWAEAVSYFIYVLNRIPVRHLGHRSPAILWNLFSPSMNKLRVFGCRCYVISPMQLRLKGNRFLPTAERAIFLGLAEDRLGYRVSLDNARTVVYRRSVVFREDEADNSLQMLPAAPQPSSPSPPLLPKLPAPSIFNSPSVGESEAGMNPESESKVKMCDAKEEKTLRRSSRKSKPVQTFAPLVNNAESKSLACIAPDSTMIDSNSMNEDSKHDVFQAYSAGIEDSPTYSQAMKSKNKPKWEEAIRREIDALVKNQTWTYIDNSRDHRGARPMRSKWVLKIKRGPKGEIVKYKARLVACGYSQPDPGFSNRFAPTMRMSTMRTLFSIASALKWDLTIADVDNAFLHGTLDEPEMMQAPPGFADYAENFKKGQMIKLKRSLYGLKNSAAVWSKTLGKFLCTLGFKRLVSDPGVFVHEANDGVCIIGSWIDDLIILCNSKSLRAKIVQALDKKFGVKDLGEPSWCLGIRIRKDCDGTYHFNQSTLIERLIEDFAKNGRKHASLPLDPRSKLTSGSTGDMGAPIDSTIYRQLIGGAMYLMTGTRPDIAFALSTLSRQVSSPCVDHMEAGRNLIRYLNKTKDYELKLGNLGETNKEIMMSCYVDASFGSDVETRRSVTGLIVLINGSPILWKSKRQSLVTLSSAEAEYVALSDAVRELLTIKNLIEELPHVIVAKPIKVFEDNQAVIKMVSSSWTTTRSRHIGIHYHFVRERFASGEFEIVFVKTGAQLADALTKAAPANVLSKLVEGCFKRA